MLDTAPLPPMNPDQESAITSMQAFLLQGNDQGEFLLEGPAGTGKTFTMQHLLQRQRGRILFTAPTNKATKVLRDSLTRDDFRPECRTIYSALGLRLEANGEVRELAEPEDPVDFSKYIGVVVDEASMESSTLRNFIQAQARMGVKFIHMGDPAQLNPVKEGLSSVWSLPDKATLSKVMRHDNQILALCTRLRPLVNHPAPNVRLENDNDGEQGVWREGAAMLIKRIQDAAADGQFSKPEFCKAIAWRNATVDNFNFLVRRVIYGEASRDKWLTGDRFILTAPAKDFGEDEKTIGTTDDEGVIERVDEAEHPVFPEFKCYRLTVAFDDNRGATLWAIHQSESIRFERKVAELAEVARYSRNWKDFWAFKEAFHQVRHAYGITAHRAQGSTYHRAFVDANDILLNRNRQEAVRCLYVACSRPKKELYLS